MLLDLGRDKNDGRSSVKTSKKSVKESIVSIKSDHTDKERKGPTISLDNLC